MFNLVVMPPLDGNNRPFFAGNSSMAMACGGSPPYAWFARPDVMNVVFVMRDNRPVMLNGCLNRPQDCLTRCVYEIEVRVTCENGRAEPVRLRLTIGDEWGSTRIEEV
ncbi:hypothetical protein [Vulcanisaeta distributa]|uniref:hypothetical protein n=1 Tax=Vulcanisaeta distributa TaxID=164451 RepID=UPI0006CFE36B|nr:hypothetical protein [Vulcanisaeta distributa]